MNRCPTCGQPLSPLNGFPNNCIQCGGKFYGIGPASQASHGDPRTSQYAGIGAANLAQYSSNHAQSLAYQNARQSGLGNLMSMPGLGPGQLMQNLNPLGPPPEPAKPLDDAGTTFGEFIGWRIWGLSHGYLTSFSADYAWLPGHPAEGDVSDHGHGGIWAFKDQHRAFKKALESVGHSLVEGWATGSVWMYGEIVEHTIGYRSQYATVRSIDELIPNETQSWKDWTSKREARRAAKLMLEELRERYIAQPQIITENV